MLRYHLDDLGPYQFEKLVQSCLKAYAGLGVESWGNRADWGRDAYAPGSLRFPDHRVLSRGPFIFQVKFVEGANSAGSKPRTALLSSSSKEVTRIRERIANGQWRNPKRFTFISNSRFEAGDREQIRSAFASVLPTEKIIIWSGDDVCDILDQHSKVARAFPQLLSIRDLDELITFALRKESKERSQVALEIAMDLAPVFAPTKSYERAWAVLQKYHFAVLEGPPEVGKSAIAWVIGLTQAGEGWEAVVCRTPDTFFQAIDRNQPQVFIADDAFGRTEYDPTRTSKWEADLDHILHRLDPHHWLIWTSRRHILKRACDRMDAQGKARSFPDPGSVLVDVKTLSAEERALILFRHAKSANLESFAKKIIRQHAKLIVSNAEFTPERVRRFVKETLPKLASATASRKINNAQLNEAVGEALRNPTKQMRLAFRSLPAAHKWFLVAFLEVSEVETPFLLYSGGNAEEVRELYEEYCPDKHHEPFEQVLEQLTEAFVSTKQSNYLGTKVDWIHPSYRDLVIDELVEDAELRNTFLRRASLEGVKLALSGIGGQYGERQMPFMSSRESWDILRQRCLSLVATNNVDREMLEIVAEAASESVSRGQHSALIAILNPVCQAIGEKWDREGRLISAIELEAFGTARKHSKPKIPCPSLDSSWDSLEERLRENMSAARRGSPFDFEAFDRLAAFAQAVRTCSPGFLSRKGFPEVYEGEIRMLMEEAKSQLEAEPFSDAPDDIRNLADRVSSNGSTVERLIDLSALYAKPASNLAHQLERRSEKLAEIAAENEPGEPGDDYDRGEPSDSSAFDIGLLFSEL